MEIGGREADVKHFLEFVRSWSGGLKDPWVLRDLEKYCKCLPEVRNIDAQMLGMLAKLDLGAAQGAVSFGMLKDCSTSFR